MRGTTLEEKNIASENTEPKEYKLAKASFNVLNMSNDSGSVYSTMKVDRMELPSDPKKMIKMCRFFYKHDPVAGTVLNKMVDCAISPIKNNQIKASDEEFYTYDSLAGLLQEFFRNACLEYLLSGIVLPQYEWVKKKGSELSSELGSRRRLTVPDNLWFRDPKTVIIKDNPVTNKKYFYVEVSAELIQFIKTGGKLADGTWDKETYKQMIQSYPEFVKAVKDAGRGSKINILLPNVRPLLSRCLSDETYPIPYMSNALESLMHKRNLRKMDYSISSRVTAAIQMIKLGDKDFPCTDEGDFQHIKDQMNYRTTKGENERIYQLFGNHTLTIEWIFPNTEAMLNQEKYQSVDDDIIAGLGFPRTLITGETKRSNVEGGSDSATFSPIATMEAIRDKLILWTIDLYKEIAEKNGFKNFPVPEFEPMKLYKLIDLNTIGESVYKEGSLSRTTRLEMLGLDFETELQRKKREEEKFKEYGLEPAPLLPYSSPEIGKHPSTEPTPKPKEKTSELSIPLTELAEEYTPLQDFEYLIHHVEVDEDGKEHLHHCMLYDHIANLFTQGHLVIHKGKAYLDGKELDAGRFHVILGLEETQETTWSDEEAHEAGIVPKRMHSGMTAKQKAKEW